MPSQLLRVKPLENDLAAYQFDSAVLFFGLTIKNASQEREDYGPEKARQSRPKYTMRELLDPEFRLPHSSVTQGGIKELALAHPGAVARWKQVA